MTYLVAFIVCFIAGIGAGLGTGFAGMSAAAVISPMLITFLGMDPYMAVGIALASRRAGQRRLGLYLQEKQATWISKTALIMMASRAGLYGGGQLCSQQGALGHHGQLLGVYDAACWASSSSCGRS